MKARERLLLIADRLDALAAATIFAGGCMPEDAAALRALADRWDAEMKKHDSDPTWSDCPGCTLLKRLDADLSPPLPEDKT